MFEGKIDLSSSESGSKKEYVAHLVPCKIRYTGPSEEFVDNFHMDPNDDQCLRKQELDGTNTEEPEDLHITYLRGRKIAGKNVLKSVADCQAYLLENSVNDTATLKCSAKISELVNYERDGNQERLIEELNKFDEFIKLSDIIHS